MIDEVFSKNKTNQKIADADERFLKISPLPDGSNVVDAKSSRIAYVADPKEDKDAINKSWAIKYFKKEKDAVAKLEEEALARSAEIDTKANSALNAITSSLNAIKTILNDFKGKQTELNALKSSLEALKDNLEKLKATGVINDTASDLTRTYSSKKIEGLIDDAKTTLANDIKSNTDSLTTVTNNLGQSITTLDGKINSTQGNLSALSTGVSSALAQKTDKSTFAAFVNKTANDLSSKADKNEVPSLTSLEDTFVKKTDAYNKTEADKKFMEKNDFPVIDKAYVGLGKVDNTADSDKPISQATQEALDAITTSLNGKANAGEIPNIVRNSLNGFIFQQGTVNVTCDSSGNAIVMYPIAFPTTPIFLRYTYSGLGRYHNLSLGNPDVQHIDPTKIWFLSNKKLSNQTVTITYAALGY
nr:MAG TPA: putative tail fiber protein [Caudoviricetes sp.]